MMPNISSAPLSLYLEVYHANHIAATSTGLVLNLFLFVVIIKCSRKSTQAAKVLLMISTLNDLWYCAFELFTRRVMYQTDGIMYIMSFGWDNYYSDWFNYFLSIVHFFDMSQSLTVQTVIHKFRYHIVTSAQPPEYSFLYKQMMIFAVPSLYLSFLLKTAMQSGTRTAYNYSMSMLPEEWKLQDGSSNVVDVALWDDPWTRIFVANNLIVDSVCYALCIHYIRKCYESINNNKMPEMVSNKTREHRSQFNRCLVAQTMLTTILIIVPSSAWMLTFVTKARGSFLGMPTMIAISWFGAVNALIPLCYIRTLRETALNMLLFRRTKSSVELFTITRIEDTSLKGKLR